MPAKPCLLINYCSTAYWVYSTVDRPAVCQGLGSFRGRLWISSPWRVQIAKYLFNPEAVTWIPTSWILERNLTFCKLSCTFLHPEFLYILEGKYRLLEKVSVLWFFCKYLQYWSDGFVGLDCWLSLQNLLQARNTQRWRTPPASCCEAK